jgi:hypothetical protein
LSDEERQFLQEALPTASEWVPGVRLIFFGSRAVGTAGPDSDYDIFFIFPNQMADWRRPQFIGSVSSLAIARGVELSVEPASEDEWLNPPEVSRPLIERVKASGIEVPWRQAGACPGLLMPAPRLLRRRLRQGGDHRAGLRGRSGPRLAR